MRRSLACVALLLATGGCGPGDGSTGEVAEVRPAEQAASTTTGSSILAPRPSHARPPAIRVRGPGAELELAPTSSCWQNVNSGMCADGRPPANPLDIGNPAELEVDFDALDWRFTATAAPTGVACGRERSVELPATGPTTHRLAPIGPAGDYTITLSGRSREGAAQKGDVSATFRWHTPRRGAEEAPTVTASIVGGRPAEVVSYGVELSARALGVSTQRDTVRASVRVTSANGASMSIDLQPRPVGDCVPEGSLFLGAPAEQGKEAARLGPAPFRYDVTLVLDSILYRGTGTWPADEMSACSPCTTLRFSPPLPAL